MPKGKTRKSAAKRFSLTGSGRVRKNRANKRHLLTKKSSDQKRNLRHGNLVHPSDEARVRRMLGQ